MTTGRVVPPISSRAAAPEPSLKEQIQARVNEAAKIVERRLLPAKLTNDPAKSSKNGYVFNAWAIKQGLVGKYLEMTPAELATELYACIVNDVQSPAPQLIWEVPPKQLILRLQQNKPQAPHSVNDVNALSEKMAAATKADAEIRRQESAKKRCLELVSRFTPVDKRGNIRFSLQAGHQAAWRKKIAESTDFVALESEIRDEQEAVYEGLERPVLVGGGQ